MMSDRDPEFMVARAGRCTVCGEPLSGAYWITDHPDGEHEACRDWSAVPFPFADNLAHLRMVARQLARAYRSTVRVGRWLAAAQRAWPRRAQQVATQQRRRWHDLRRELKKLADRLP